MTLAIDRNRFGFKIIDWISVTGSAPGTVFREELSTFQNLDRQSEISQHGTDESTTTALAVTREFTVSDEDAQGLPPEITLLALAGTLPSPAPESWMRTINMFADDPIMQEIFAEAQRIRDDDRSHQ